VQKIEKPADKKVKYKPVAAAKKASRRTPVATAAK